MGDFGQTELKDLQFLRGNFADFPNWEVLETRPDRNIRSYGPYSFKEERAFFNLLTTMSDQDRISPYNINTISRQVIRIKKNINQGIIS